VGRTDAGAADWLQQLECPNGGWQYDRVDPAAPCAAEAITTGYVMQGLAAVGRGVPPDAIQFLDEVQQPDGGFPLLPGVTDLTATAVGLQGLIAAGEDPNTNRWRKGSGAGSATPFTALIRRNTDVGGGFSQQPDDPPDANLTSRVVPGVAGQPLPIAAAAPVVDPGVGTPGSGGDSTDTAGSDSTQTANPAGDAAGFSPLTLLGLAAGSSAIVAVIYAFRRRRQAI
jgi:hypothetical protein